MRIALPCLAAAALLLPDTARAERPEWIIEEDQPHPEFILSALGGWYLTGFGGEARISFPVGPDGAIEYLNESFALELGFGYQYYLDRSGNFHRLNFPLTVRWDFHLTPLWTVYGAVGAAGGYVFGRTEPDVFGYHGYVWVVASLGAFLHLADGFALRMEAGSLGLLVGISGLF